jgi:hypothetical protein
LATPASPNPLREWLDDDAREVMAKAATAQPAPAVQPAPASAGTESWTKANADRPSTPLKTKRSTAREKCPAPYSPPSVVPPAKKQWPKVPEVEA